MDINYKKIGEHIRRRRKSKDMSQEKLAEYTDLSVTHISHIETASTKVSLPSIIKIADALDCTANDFLYDNLKCAKILFEKEIEHELQDCSEYEIRVLFDLIKATKTSLRSRKILKD